MHQRAFDGQAGSSKGGDFGFTRDDEVLIPRAWLTPYLDGMPIGSLGVPSLIDPQRVRAPRTGPSRAFVRVETLEVRSDELRRKATVRFELPLSAFDPPLRREDVEGLSVRIAPPIGDRSVVPLQVVESNGRLAVAFESAPVDLSALHASPLLLALGEPGLLFDPAHPEVASPSLHVQVSTAQLKVDVTASMQHERRERSVQLDGLIEQTATERRATATGTSSWFGQRQLEQELKDAKARVNESRQTLAPLLAQAGKMWSEAAPMKRVVSAPVDEPRRAAWRSTLVTAANATLALPEARALLETSREVPELATQDREKASALEALAAQQASVDAEVRQVFDALPEETRTRWLVDIATLEALPIAGELASTARALRNATSDVQLLEDQLAAHAETAGRAVAPRLVQLDARIAELRREKELLDAAPAETSETTPVTYGADLRLL